MDSITITTPHPDDARAVQEVFYKTWLATYPNESVGITVDDIEHWYQDDREEKLNKLKNRISNPLENQYFFIAKSSDKVVGVCRGYTSEDKNQLHAIYVLPEYQGKGIGKMLWSEALKIMDPNKDTYVEVADYNTNAIEFYKKLGFVDTGRGWQDEHFKMKSGNRIPLMELVIKAGNLR